jgi:hypothetical protein
MTAPRTLRTGLVRSWALWTVGFLAFPIAGLAGRAIAGPVDDLLAAALGYRTSLADVAVMGVLTAVPLGIAQALAVPPTTSRRWLWAATTPALWGARLDDHHAGRDRCRQPIHDLRRQRGDHVLRALGSRAPRTAAAGGIMNAARWIAKASDDFTTVAPQLAHAAGLMGSASVPVQQWVSARIRSAPASCSRRPCSRKPVMSSSSAIV